MNITVDISAQARAELARQAELAGRGLETYAAALLEDAAHVPAHEALNGGGPASGERLVEACVKVRGALTYEEIDTLFSRTPSSSRSVLFE